MPETARLQLDGKTFELPVVVGTEGERAVDISKLRDRSGYITLDDGYSNTGSCKSSITFIDGERGILRYRGIPIEQLAEHSTFLETAWLLIYGELPTARQLDCWSKLLTEYEMIHEGLYHHFDGFPSYGHPMAILSAMINAESCYEPELITMESPETFQLAAARLLSKIRTIAAASYKTSIGQPIVYPKPQFDYCSNFLHMMYSIPFRDYEPDPIVVAALQLILILHADHEQNCSTSTVRLVASSDANLYASCAAGVCALWGPLHGGANAAVIEMLQYLHDNKVDLTAYIASVKERRFQDPAHGIRPPRLQELRPPGSDHQEDGGQSPGESRKIRSASRDSKTSGRRGTQRPLFRRTEALSQRGLLLGHHHACHRHTLEHVHGDVRDRADAGLDSQLEGSAGRGQPHIPAATGVFRGRSARLHAHPGKEARVRRLHPALGIAPALPVVNGEKRGHRPRPVPLERVRSQLDPGVSAWAALRCDAGAWYPGTIPSRDRAARPTGRGSLT